MMNSIVFISGNSNPQLAKDICSNLGITCSESSVTYFSNTEGRPVIAESVRGRTVYILQSGSHNAVDPETGRELSVNDMVMETLLVADAVTRSGCKNIILLCPCYPYARQDKKDKARAAISAKVVADLFEAKGIKRIVATELHNPCIQGFFGKSVDNLYTMDLIVDWLREDEFEGEPHDNYVVISPDEGGFKRGSVFADKLGLPFLAMSKQRDYSQKNVVSKNVLLGDSDVLKGKTAIILDDMLDTGGTAIQTIWLLVELGAKDVIICVTHGVLSGNAVERIEGCERLKYLLMSDSLSLPHHANFAKAKGKLRVFTLAKLYSDVVQRLVEGRSISEIFE
jgi:ribose-phosphate pyrophosphokinase